MKFHPFLDGVKCTENGQVFYFWKEIKKDRFKIENKFYTKKKILAETFLKNYGRHTIVTFKDGNKNNYEVSNLKWGK